MEKQSSVSISMVTRSYLYRVCNGIADTVIGKILTLTDAVAKDDVQRKALKDLIQTAVWSVIHEAEKEMGYFCDDLRDKLGEKPEEQPNMLTRVNIFE